MSDILPTKSNLIKLKKTITLSKQGQELLEKKKYILIKEKEKYYSKKKKIEENFNEQYKKAFYMLQNANVDIEISKVNNIAYDINIDNKLDIKYKTVMGVEIPIVSYENKKIPDLTFGLLGTTITLDEAIVEFQKLKEILIDLAQIKTTLQRLDEAIQKVQKRSNSLKDIIIPNYIKQQKTIQETLDERDREEFTRLKVIKK